MRKSWILVIFLITLAGSAWAQEASISTESILFENEVEKAFWEKGQGEVFHLFRAVKASEKESTSQWDALVQELDHIATKDPDQLKLLRQIFQKTHQRLLKKYELHSSFNTMLSSGKYDCVSGSAAIGMLLDRYGFSFDVVETDYHVFIVANVEGKEIIIESTLPVGGMITTPSEVEAYLKSYTASEGPITREINQRLAGPQVDYQNNSIFRKVNLKELAGLQYFNDAIVQFNSQAFDKAIHQLSKAYLLYPSERIEGLRELSIELANKPLAYQSSK